MQSLENHGFDLVRKMWLERALYKGQIIKIYDDEKETQGVFVDIDAKDGALILEIEGKGQAHIYTGSLSPFP